MGSIFRRAVFDQHVLALDEARFLQTLAERGDQVREVGERGVPQETNNRHRRLLRAHRERPHSRRAAEQRDELAPLHHCNHSITSSATKRKSRLIVSPSSLAVFRLMTNSNLVGCSTGKSAGLAPLRILSTYVAVRRNRSGRFAP